MSSAAEEQHELCPSAGSLNRAIRVICMAWFWIVVKSWEALILFLFLDLDAVCASFDAQ